VFGSVKANTFFLLADTKKAGELESKEDNTGGDDGPASDGKNTNKLVPELVSGGHGVVVEAVSTLNVGAGGEDTNGKNTPDTASTVDREGVKRVVNSAALDGVGGADVDNGTDEADHHGSPRLNNGARGGDGDETSEDTVEAESEDVGSKEDARVDHSGDGSHGGGNGSGNSDLGGKVDVRTVSGTGTESGTAVESVPSHPEDRDTKSAKKIRVSLNLGADFRIVGEKLAARTDGNGTHKTSETTNHVDNTGSSEVDHTVLLEERLTIIANVEGREPSSSGPDPVDNDRVDEGSKDDGVHEVTLKTATLGNGSGDNGGGGTGESPLEEPAVVLSVVVEVLESPVSRADELVVVSRVVVGVAAVSVGERVSKEPEADSTDGGIHKVLEQNVVRVLFADGSSLEHSETSLHPCAHIRSDQSQSGKHARSKCKTEMAKPLYR